MTRGHGPNRAPSSSTQPVRAAARQDRRRPSPTVTHRGRVQYLAQRAFSATIPAATRPLPMTASAIVGQRQGQRLAWQKAPPIASPASQNPPAPEGGAADQHLYTAGRSRSGLRGRVADLRHPANAHTDGDTYVLLQDRQCRCEPATPSPTAAIPTSTSLNGGNIKGMIAAADAYLKITNAKSRIVPGHGPLADKAALTDYRAMLVTGARSHGQAGQGRQERGRGSGGQAVCRSRQRNGRRRNWPPRISFASSITRSRTSLTEKSVLRAACCARVEEHERAHCLAPRRSPSN